MRQAEQSKTGRGCILVDPGKKELSNWWVLSRDSKGKPVDFGLDWPVLKMAGCFSHPWCYCADSSHCFGWTCVPLPGIARKGTYRSRGTIWVTIDDRTVRQEDQEESPPFTERWYSWMTGDERRGVIKYYNRNSSDYSRSRSCIPVTHTCAERQGQPSIQNERLLKPYHFCTMKLG